MLHLSDYLVWAIQQNRRDEAERRRRTRALIAADQIAPQTRQFVQVPVVEAPPSPRAGALT